jgi:uncharacterized membrane protein YhaH (DUF805 family)
MNWVLMPLRRFADFEGRSRRTEFWLFMLVVLVVQLLANYADSAARNPALIGRMRTAEALVTLIAAGPVAAVSVRRLHDVGRAGWWMLALAIPYAIWVLTVDGSAINSGALLVFAIAALGLLVMLVQPGTAGPNAFGDSPKAIDGEPVAGDDRPV